MSFFLAVDAGGTSTRVAVLDAGGTCLGYGRAAGGNPVSAGPERAAAEVVNATRDAVRAAGLRVQDLSSGVAAMAGVSVITDDAWLAEAFTAAQIPLRPVILPDLLATFASGTLSPHGYAIVAGTGAVAVRVRDGRIDAVADGLGWLVGDEGSGFWIGHQVVRAAAAVLDGRGPDTALADLLLRELDITGGRSPDPLGRPRRLQRTVDVLYRLRPVDLAQFAPLAFQAGEDQVAASIIARAQAALATSLAAVVLPEVVGPLIASGSVLAHQRSLAAPLPQVLTDAGLAADLHHVPDGMPGAAVLALRDAGIEVRPPMMEAILTSLPKAQAAAPA